MPAKAPIYLKPTNSKKGKKCRLRDILSPDMISPPLGDFRHTIHIGRGGHRDAFGDMSFLQGKYELLPGKVEFQAQYGVQSEFLRANSAGDASFVETPSPVLKNAISLPSIGGCQALTLPLVSSAVFSMPPEPLGDTTDPTTPQKMGSVEDVAMDTLLHAIDSLGSNERNVQLKPDVLLDLLQSTKPDCKANTEKPSSCYINGHSNTSYKANGSLQSNTSYKANGSLHSNTSYKANGSLHSNTSSDSLESLETKLYHDKSYLNKSHLLGHFSNNINLELKELSECHGEWADRDSGVDEGRNCDFDFEKSPSRESLTRITGSLLSLELDLGPSIMDDVLNIMDKPAVKSRP
uniref:cdc42 effector protein 3 n=1 Tax=Doryrhamphus excisus TaxID=161450 RepID=UPI0025ADC256|nr:cdc42 effector protein 3 [Doryrhamphus excisus]